MSKKLPPKYSLEELDFEDSRLTPKARFVLHIMAMYACSEDGKVFPIIAKLTRQTGFSQASIYRALADLEAFGYLVPTERGRFTVNILAWQSQSTVSHSEKSYPQKMQTGILTVRKFFSQGENNSQGEKSLYIELDTVTSKLERITSAQNLSTEGKGDRPCSFEGAGLPPKRQLLIKDPSFGAQQKLMEIALKLKIEQKGANESWADFRERLSQACKITTSRGEAYA